jgi:hypothetical protein
MHALAQTRASLVIANIPDATQIPYFISAETIASQANLPVGYVRCALGLAPGDTLRPAAMPLVPAILADPKSGPLPKLCGSPDGPDVIPGLPYKQVPCVFRAAEALTVRAYINFFNLVIAGEAIVRRAALVDIYSLFDGIQKNGYAVDGRHLTANFLGGLISLDGIHPTNTLHAIFANEFIKVMNREFKTAIPMVSVADVANQDPLVPKG